MPVGPWLTGALCLTTALTSLGASAALAQEKAPAPKPGLKDELRMPWKRGDETFLRLWLVAGPPYWQGALVAAVCCMMGLLVERWLFFAEAKHTVRLYHGEPRT